MNANFELMCRRTGGYALPWLIRLYDDDETESLYFVNNSDSITYGGNTYVASTFTYTPNASEDGFGGGGTLEIAVGENGPETDILDMIQTYRSVRLDVIGVLSDNGTVTEVKTYANHYGSITWTAKKATFDFDKDDRLEMTFPALIFNASNNRGNT